MAFNKPNRLYLLKPNYDIEASLTKELPNSQSNDTELNNTNYIENEDNDTYDMNDIISNTLINNNHHSNHTNHQKTEFNNDALKFQVLEELPQQLQDYLSKFEIKKFGLLKAYYSKGKSHLILHMILIIV